MILALFIVGTVGFHFIEGWSFFDSFYTTIVTLATVGYGDFHPASVEGRVFAVVLIIFGVGALAYFVTLVIDNLVDVRLRTILGRGKVEKKISSMKDHYIICGFGKIGRHVGRELFQEKANFVVIDNDPERIQTILDEGYLAVKGNATEDRVLKEAGLERAKALVSVLPTDAENLYVVLTAKELNPNLYIISRYAEEEASEKRLLKAGANRVMSPYREGGVKMALAVLKPAMLDFIEITTRRQSIELRMEEVNICPDSPIAGKSLEESGLRRDYGIIAIAVKKESGRMIFNPEASYVIETGDNLIALGEEKNLVRFASVCQI